ncbi:MAG: DUF4124 domain-containing protein [Burkholderiales bacterium]
MRQTLLILLCVTLSGGASAEVNKWVDAEGKVHYSDQVPPDVKADPRKLDIKSTSAIPSSAPGAQAGKSVAERELEYRKGKVEEEEAAAKQQQADADAKIRQENCKQARGNLKTLEAGGKIYKYDDKGEHVYLDDEQIQKSIAQARRDAESWCD